MTIQTLKSLARMNAEDTWYINGHVIHATVNQRERVTWLLDGKPSTAAKVQAAIK